MSGALNLKLSSSDFPLYKAVLEEIRHAAPDAEARRNILIKEAATIEGWSEDVSNFVKGDFTYRVHERE